MRVHSKKIGISLLFSLFFVVFVSGCVSAFSPTQLTIKNDSTTDLYSVEWNDTDFGTIEAGSQVTEEVSSGTDYIYFWVGWYFVYTEDSITVSEGDQVTYVITDSTQLQE